MTETVTEKRPGVVTFVAILVYIKGIMALVVGLALAFGDREAIQAATGQSAGSLGNISIAESLIGLLLILVASALMGRKKWARVATAIVVAIRLALATYWMITHIGGGLQWNAIIATGLAVFILWALYGDERSQEYFEGHP